jgi:hypothetical protein
MRQLIFMVAAICAGAAALAQGVPPPPSEVARQSAASAGIPAPLSDEPMAEHTRAAISKVVLMPGASPTNEEVEGDYEKDTYGLWGGAVAGSTASTTSVQAGPVAVNIPIPILQLPGMLAGGIAGATQREIQDFRDALTEDLVKASSQQLINEKIASDVYYEIRMAPNLEPELFARDVEVAEDTDAIVYIGVRDLIIDVEDDEAVITANVTATVHRPGDETDVYKTLVSYQDRDVLKAWTANDNAVWRDYANFARHYVGRELAALIFNSAGVGQKLSPVKSRDVSVNKKNPWDATSRKLSPTLQWELALPGGDNDPAWAAGIDESNIYYDLEIYDLHRPIYTAKNIPGTEHTVNAPLTACEAYRWSVRPSFHVGGDIKYGDWMRWGAVGNGNIGQKASEAPAYLFDFAKLEIKCGSK